MIRPEILAAFRRNSEVLGSLTLVGLGGWIVLRSGWFWMLIGALIVLAGLGLAYISWRKLAFRSEEVGPGVVEVDERQISYFSAYEGGAVSINQLARVSAVTGVAGGQAKDVHWVLEEDGGARLVIPNSAAGAEQLFDAFAALDGVDYASASRAIGALSNESLVIWSKPHQHVYPSVRRRADHRSCAACGLSGRWVQAEGGLAYWDRA